MKNRFYLFLTYLLVVSSIVTIVSFSRYATVVSGSGNAQVAQAVIEYVPISATLNGIPIDLIGNGITVSDILPGDVLIYSFDVKNFNEVNINQVLMKYNISVSFGPDPEAIPLVYYLTPLGSYQSAGDGWIYMGFGTEETHSYRLTISWDTAEDDPSYTNKQQDIQIQINSEQLNG